MNNRNIGDDALDAIAAAGFDVYQSPDWPTYLYFTDGTRVGYLQSGAFGGFEASTVHIPNRTTGTGFKATDDLSLADLTRSELEKAFAIAPHWASGSDRAPVAKWKNWAAFHARNPNLVKVRARLAASADAS